MKHFFEKLLRSVKNNNFYKIFILVLFFVFNTSIIFAASPSNYVNINNNGPAPANFRAYADDSPWNLPLPANPQNTNSTLTTNIRVYANNTPQLTWYTADNNFITGCNRAVSSCGGNGGFPIYKATTSDIPVTFSCDQNNGAYYGCTSNDVRVTTTSVSGYIPANARPGCTDYNTCGDRNMTIIQPDGTVIDVYGCAPSRNFQSGDRIGSGGTICSNFEGMVISSITQSKGINGSTTSGPNYAAETVRYNEVISGSINHALQMPVSCTSTGYMYPGTGDTYQCSSGGVPAGTHFYLDLNHAEIDAMISAGTLSSTMKPFYYALHDYGGYVVDTTGYTNPSFDGGSGGPYLEDARPWLQNGNINPWVQWFDSQPNTTVYHEVNSGGNPIVYFRNNFWRPIATHLVGLSECYARGTCNDSVTTPPPPPPVPTTSLIGQWKLNENSGLVAADTSGKNHQGSVTEAVWTSGKAGNGLQFDGVNDYADMGDIGNTNSAGMSVSFWVYYNTLPAAWSGVLGKASGGGTNLYQYVIGSSGAGGDISLNTSDANGQYTGLCPVSLSGKTNQWLHVVYVWNSDADTCSVYFNGVQVASQNVTIGMNTTATHPLRLGQAYKDSSYTLNGKLDEVGIYNYSLSGTEITNLYNAGTVVVPPPVPTTSLIGQWKLNETSGITTADSSGKNHPGFVTEALWIAGKIGNALKFDGINDYVDMGDIGNTSSTNMSASFWVYYNALPKAWSGVLGKASGGGTNLYQYVIGSSGAGGDISLNTSDANGQYTGLCPVSVVGKTNQWLHVVYIWSADNDACSAYLNGVQISSQNVQIGMNATATHPLRLGQAYKDGAYTLDGSLDEVNIYNYGLSGTEITNLYNAGTVVVPPPPPVPLGITIDSWSITRTNATTLSVKWGISSTGGSNIVNVQVWAAPTGTNCTNKVKTGCAWQALKTVNAPSETTNWISSTNVNVAKKTTYFVGLHAIDSLNNLAYEPYLLKVSPTAIIVAENEDGPSFVATLSKGSSGLDVAVLQKVLSREVGHPIDLITGYFGNLTLESVKKFQKKYNITPTGIVGEITRTRLNALLINAFK